MTHPERKTLKTPDEVRTFEKGKLELVNIGGGVVGRLHVKNADGSEFEAGPGDVSALPSGHDAWVVGSEPVVVIDWSGAMNDARR